MLRMLIMLLMLLMLHMLKSYLGDILSINQSSLPHFVYDFSRKMLLMLHSIN